MNNVEQCTPNNTICDPIHLNELRQRFAGEVLKTMRLAFQKTTTAQINALKDIFKTYDDHDYIRCQLAIDSFLADLKVHDVLNWDISQWSYSHVHRWFIIIFGCYVYDRKEITLHQFACMIYGEFLNRMPPEERSDLIEYLGKNGTDHSDSDFYSSFLTEEETPLVNIGEIAGELCKSTDEIIQELSKINCPKIEHLKLVEDLFS